MILSLQTCCASALSPRIRAGALARHDGTSRQLSRQPQNRLAPLSYREWAEEIERPPHLDCLRVGAQLWKELTGRNFNWEIAEDDCKPGAISFSGKSESAIPNLQSIKSRARVRHPERRRGCSSFCRGDTSPCATGQWFGAPLPGGRQVQTTGATPR